MQRKVSKINYVFFFLVCQNDLWINFCFGEKFAKWSACYVIFEQPLLHSVLKAFVPLDLDHGRSSKAFFTYAKLSKKNVVEQSLRRMSKWIQHNITTFPTKPVILIRNYIFLKSKLAKETEVSQAMFLMQRTQFCLQRFFEETSNILSKLCLTDACLLMASKGCSLGTGLGYLTNK